GRGRRNRHVTQGTAAIGPHQLLLPAIRALSNRSDLVVATTGTSSDRLAVHPMPRSLRVAHFLPHEKLLPHVDVMVTNGGHGGVTAALAHGVPVVTCGRSEDKGEVSARVAWSGAGREIRWNAEQPFAWQIRCAVQKVLRNPSYAA